MKNERYVAVIEFYVYAESDDEAQVQAQKACDDLNNKNACQADVQLVVSARFGEMFEGKKVYENGK